MKTGFAVAMMFITIGLCSRSFGASTQYYVVTNDDVDGPNTLTFYIAEGTVSAPKLTRLRTLPTGGSGLGGGYFGIVRQLLLQDGQNECIFAADGGSSDIAGVIGNTQVVVGNYKGSGTDSGGAAGVGLAMSPSGKYLYAAFSGSRTIATFTIGSGCALTFVSDVSATGLNAGFPHGMAARNNILIVAFGDGSIGSFNISSGLPVSNNDLQLSTGYLKNRQFPDGVDITQDGHFAVFGDASDGFSQVEVSDLSSGHLATTVNYGGDGSLGQGLAANNVWLSPDETLLYVSDNLSGQVTAAFFDRLMGKVKFGCISQPLRGFGTSWSFSSSVTTASTSGTGSVLWVAEDGRGVSASSVGIVDVSSKGGTCSLTESTNSPAADRNSLNLCWLNAFPTRSF